MDKHCNRSRSFVTIGASLWLAASLAAQAAAPVRERLAQGQKAAFDPAPALAAATGQWPAERRD
jgi:hypothetical protein